MAEMNKLKSNCRHGTCYTEWLGRELLRWGVSAQGGEVSQAGRKEPSCRRVCHQSVPVRKEYLQRLWRLKHASFWKKGKEAVTVTCVWWARVTTQEKEIRTVRPLFKSLDFNVREACGPWKRVFPAYLKIMVAEVSWPGEANSDPLLYHCSSFKEWLPLPGKWFCAVLIWVGTIVVHLCFHKLPCTV